METKNRGVWLKLGVTEELPEDENFKPSPKPGVSPAEGKVGKPISLLGTLLGFRYKEKRGKKFLAPAELINNKTIWEQYYAESEQLL